MKVNKRWLPYLLAVLIVGISFGLSNANPAGVSAENSESKCYNHGGTPGPHVHNSVTINCEATVYYSGSYFYGTNWGSASAVQDDIDIINQGWESCVFDTGIRAWITQGADEDVTFFEFGSNGLMNSGPFGGADPTLNSQGTVNWTASWDYHVSSKNIDHPN